MLGRGVGIRTNAREAVSKQLHGYVALRSRYRAQLADFKTLAFYESLPGKSYRR